MNAPTATSAYQKPYERPNVSPARGAAKTSRFFGHCRGRVLCTTAFSHLAEPARRVGVPFCGSVSLAAGVGTVMWELSSVLSCGSCRGGICRVGAVGWELSSGEYCREVSVGDVEIAVRRLDLTAQQVHRCRV